MIDVHGIDQLAQRLAALVPPGLAQARGDLEANFRDVLAQGLRRLDLASREEFDVQRTVLVRTAARIEELERRITELETALTARGH
ncbi:MAG: accessory factor UbiK family protein [Mizugakiibacter sp.]|uniref:accessory factor UbiK family protein n=1 Tax=Mizugakiibacter sp. TaxID=1972610 RepID=UPI0031BFA77C|nr:accessory factor UbiK family protein [Xanthomonadaceae bacterium]